ncbi:MAG TPA: hypothetical protein VM098_09430, partial [Phycisphaerae bacterium]|nr:hypothetical protein [Phycisphaerae bacterium]
MRSLRSRLVVGVMGGIVLLLVLFSLAVYALVRRSLVAEFDASLAATARILIASVEQEDDEIDFKDLQQLPEFEAGKHPAYFQLYLDGGGVLGRSPSLGNDSLPDFSGTVASPAVRRLTLPGGKPGRAVGIKFVPAEEPDKAARHKDKPHRPEVVLVVARNTINLLSNLRVLRWVLAGAGAAVLIMAMLVSAGVVRRGLRPLTALAERIVSIKEDKLDDRVSVDQMPSEIAPVAEKLNDFLARLE